eukprot:224495-Pyramimonas_sp.AAC.1
MFREEGHLRVQVGARRLQAPHQLSVNTVIHSHVNDLLAVGQEDCPEADQILSEMAKCLRLVRRDREFDCCGVHIKDTERG